MNLDLENDLENASRNITEPLNSEYESLYTDFEDAKLKKVLSTLHHMFVCNYEDMNKKLPTDSEGAHFWANQSRNLISAIGVTENLVQALKETEYAFELDSYYKKTIESSSEFLENSNGSTIPPHMNKVEIYYKKPMFIKKDRIIVLRNSGNRDSASLKLIGEGSYAQVLRFTDSFYNRKIVVKRAKKGLNKKELQRFKREFQEMSAIKSPYIVEVYCYDEETNQYLMEYMDYTLKEYIETHNSKLSMEERFSCIAQIVRGFQHLHSKNILHRDISPTNILVKKYDDVNVFKISDFGLVKIPNSSLTRTDTDFKGCLNDQRLEIDGFKTYKIVHETYALTRLIYFILTGRFNLEKAPAELKDFLKKGTSANLEERFQTVEELWDATQKFRSKHIKI